MAEFRGEWKGQEKLEQEECTTDNNPYLLLPHRNSKPIAYLLEYKI